MKKVISWLKNIHLARIVTVFLAGIILFVSTACGGSKVLAKTADEARQEVPSRAVTNTYKGGMNDYNDVDPRTDTTEAKAKAKALIENAQRNINQKGVDSPEKYAENYKSGTPLGERVRRIGEDVGDSTEEVAEGASKGVQKGVQNIKKNAQKAPEYLKNTAQETANVNLDKVQTKANNSIKGTQQGLDNAANAGRNIGQKIQDAVRDTADSVKGKVNRDIGRTQQALEDAANAID